MPKKIFLIACEPSGDTHAAHLVEKLLKKAPDLELRGLGGPEMAKAGVHLLHDMTTLSVLGFGDVIRQYFTYKRIFNRALKEVRDFKPHAIVVVDSPAFNLRFAKAVNKQFPVIYYIAPQLWAWGKRRIHTVQRTISKMLVALPFEEALYREAKIPCEFVGHPLLDTIPPSVNRTALRNQFGIRDHEQAIGLLPGSRKTEVKRILPLMVESAVRIQKKIPQAIFFLTPSPNVDPLLYDDILKKYPALKIRRISKKLREIVPALDFALITSGTATLEATLLGTPFFLLYKAGWVTYFLGKYLIRVPFLGLTNLLAGKRVIPEFIQQDIHPETIAHEAEVLLKNRELYEKMKRDFKEIWHKLGDSGASERAANAVLLSLIKK